MAMLVSLMLFGVTTAMMSGTGALFEEQLGISFHVGVILTAFFSFIVMLKGMDGILSVNTLVVPLMFLFMLLVAFHAWKNGDLSSLLVLDLKPKSHLWLGSAVVYVAFNLVMMQAVLVPLGAQVEDEQTIRRGGWIGGLGLGFMLLSCNAAMQLHWHEVSRLKIPMAFVINTLGAGTKYFFLALMWAEIFTTLIGNVYGLTTNLRRVVPFRERTIMGFIFVLAYMFSLFGFPTLVHFLYPLFGYCGLVLFLFLMIRRLPAI
jgi:uncharacterized membrane protein YkvI